MGGVPRYFSKISGSGVDLTLLNKELGLFAKIGTIRDLGVQRNTAFLRTGWQIGPSLAWFAGATPDHKRFFVAVRLLWAFNLRQVFGTKEFMKKSSEKVKHRARRSK